MLHKMMRRFDASDEHIKELRCDLASIWKKFDTHAISIRQIELQMAQLSATVNTWTPGTLPSNTIQNPKNDAHCMAITTRGGKQNSDPPMPSTEENVRKDNDNVVKGSVEVAFYQCPFGRISRTNARLCQIYERSGHQEKICTFEDDD